MKFWTEKNDLITTVTFSPISVLYKWLYFVATIAASISYMFFVPKIKSHVILITVAFAEIVAILMASTPVLASKFQVRLTFAAFLVIDALKLLDWMVKLSSIGEYQLPIL